jgi:glycerol kinase
LTLDSDATDIVIAALEAVAFQTRDLLEAMQADHCRPAELRVDGGMAANTVFMQRLADITGLPVCRPRVTETTALGAAFLAGLQAGVYDDLQQIAGLWQLDARFSPVLAQERRAQTYAGWLKALARVKSRSQ